MTFQDRTGQVWEDAYGRLHLIIRSPELHVHEDRSYAFHRTLRLLCGGTYSVTDTDSLQLEAREGWSRIA